jgi:uncharacterized protein YjbI with pentapeptide repeats
MQEVPMADDKLVALIRDEKHNEFNELAKAAAEKGEKVDLSSAPLRACDLRRFDLRNANLTGAYLRLADMRGLDLSNALMEHSSLKEAKISGVLFPSNIIPQELDLSHREGIRIRTIK